MPAFSAATLGAIGAVGSFVGPIAGGIIGNMASEGDRKKAMEASERAMEEIERIGAPPDVAKEIMLREYQSAGVLTPDVEKQVDLGISKVSQIQEAPEMREAQLGALKKLRAASEMGMTPEARAELLGARAQTQRDTQAKMQQILQQQQQRGQASAGAGLAAQLQMASAGGMEESDAAIKAAAEASRSALAAAAQSGALGGQIRGQEFDIARTKAGAEDQFTIARFNEEMGRQQRNIAALNAAQQYNLAQKQRIVDLNVAQRNAEMQRQVQAQENMWRMGLDRAKARAAARGGQAQQFQQQAAQTQQGWGQFGSGMGAGFGALSQYGMGREDAQQRSDNRTFEAQQRQLDREAYGRGNRATSEPIPGTVGVNSSTLPDWMRNPKPSSSSSSDFDYDNLHG